MREYLSVVSYGSKRVCVQTETPPSEVQESPTHRMSATLAPPNELISPAKRPKVLVAPGRRPFVAGASHRCTEPIVGQPHPNNVSTFELARTVGEMEPPLVRHATTRVLENCTESAGRGQMYILAFLLPLPIQFATIY